MPKTASVVLFVVLMLAVIVGADILLFRHHFWLRLIANVGIVAVFLVIYWVFLKDS
jgi:preprotein translocase subunit SecE